MTHRFSLRAATGAVLVVLFGCPAPVRTPPPPAAPRIVSFTATPNAVRAGESVQLSFEVDNADTLELLDQSGQSLMVSGTSHTVTPTTSTLYVLRATGKGGRDSAYVRVTVDDVDSIFLVAVPNEVASGDEVSLVWSALGGSTGVALTDGTGMPLPLTGTSGLITVKPARSTKYTLRADQGAGETPLVVEAPVTVRPVVRELRATPPAAPSGQVITVEWATAGAERVTLTEATFGELFSSTTAVDTGQFDFTVPAAMPGDGGTTLPNGFPLSFTLAATTTAPPQTATRVLPSTVGTGPQIFAFDLPAFATEQSQVQMGWRASGVRTELLADGQVVYSASGLAAESGATVFPTPTVDVVFTLVVYDANGLSVRRDRQLKVVKRPDVMTFTAPTQVLSGNTAMVSWQTRDAATVTVRLKDGPVIFSTDDPTRLATGMAQVRIGRPTELVLEAINAAGDKDVERKRIDVTQPASVTVTPDPAAPGHDLTLAWNFATQMPLEVHGVPVAPPLVQPASTAFFDLSAQPLANQLVFANLDDGLASFTPPSGFVFPFLDESTSTFWVSTNGFVALSSTSAPMPDNVDVMNDTANASLPALLAPFWDDLRLTGPSSVLWMVEGTSFPRRLIIQWNRLTSNADFGSELTFQAQLYETGRFRFAYQRLSGATSGQGQGATVAVTGGAQRFRASFAFNQALLSEGLELDWFTSAQVSGSFVTRASRPGVFTPFLLTANNAWVAAPLRTRVFAPGSVRVSEVMAVTHPVVPLGRWVELHNPGTDEVDVGGLQLFVADAGAASVVITGPRVVPANGFFVIGESTMPADNGDAPVQEAWPMGGLNLPSNAQLNLRVPGSPDGGSVSQLAWGDLADGGTTPAPGISVYADARAVRGSPPTPLVCGRSTAAYGLSGSLGTPGAANESCFPYRLTSITPAYEDISLSGTKLFTGTTVADFDDKFTTIPLSPAFTYFGQSYGSLTVNTNGFVTVIPSTATAQTNKVAPSSTAPTGTIAIYWDDIAKKDTATDGSVYTERKNGYRIIHWHHYGTWRSEGTVDDFNFQVKLFDTGVIEFHYATMRGNSQPQMSDGRGATVWLEQPGGASALPISINTPAPRQNTAWRFTPVP